MLLIAERARRRGAGPASLSGAVSRRLCASRASSGELFRQPDAQLGFLIFGTTMGQLLSIPLLLAGIALIVLGARRRRGRRPPSR